jgi:hypothetical protein
VSCGRPDARIDKVKGRHPAAPPTPRFVTQTDRCHANASDASDRRPRSRSRSHTLDGDCLRGPHEPDRFRGARFARMNAIRIGPGINEHHGCAPFWQGGYISIRGSFSLRLSVWKLRVRTRPSHFLHNYNLYPCQETTTTKRKKNRKRPCRMTVTERYRIRQKQEPSACPTVHQRALRFRTLVTID